MENFELQFWDVGGCVGYPLISKSILKASSQMVRLCDYATVLFSYLHIGFLTFLALLKTHSEMEHPVFQVGTYYCLFLYPTAQSRFEKKYKAKSINLTTSRVSKMSF